MKRCALALLVLFGSAYCPAKDRADVCPSLEYAELKGMSTLDLYSLYCQYDNSAAELGARAAKGEASSDDTDQYLQCDRESLRIMKLLLNDRHQFRPCPKR